MNSRNGAIKCGLASLFSGLMAIHLLILGGFIAPHFSAHPARTLLLGGIWAFVMLLQVSPILAGMLADASHGVLTAKTALGQILGTSTLVFALVLLDSSRPGVIERLRAWRFF